MNVQGTIYVISDGTGETAMTMIRAALVHFAHDEVRIVRCKNVRTDHQVHSLMDDIAANKGFVVFTVVSTSLQTVIQQSAIERGIPILDLLGPLLQGFSTYFGIDSVNHEVGRLRTVNEKYFKRIEAIEYTVKHDDGKELRDLNNADIILVGISRTSKTPLSIFLSHKGWKVANVPVVLGVPLPEELFAADQRKIVGLIIDSDKLQRIRKKRVEKLGDTGGDYAQLKHIHDEILFSHQLFQSHRRWPVFDVTERALEETAAEIMRVVCTRMGWNEEDPFR